MKWMLILVVSMGYLNYTPQQKDYSHDETYEIAKDGKFILNTNDANVFITGSDREDAHVKIERTVEGKVWTNHEFDIEISSNGKNLEVNETTTYKGENDFSISFGKGINYNIWIELPSTVSLEIVGDDDDYEIGNIEGQLSLNAGDGDVKLNDIMSNKIEVSIDDGDIMADRISGDLTLIMNDGDAVLKNGSLDRIDVTLDDGDFDLHNDRMSKLELKAYDGDITIYCSLSENAEIDIDIEDGDLLLDVDDGGGIVKIRHDDGDISYSKSAYTLSESKEYSKELRSVDDSNAEIRINTEDGDVTLK